MNETFIVGVILLGLSIIINEVALVMRNRRTRNPDVD